MFEKIFIAIFGKKKSIQRKIIKTAVLYILIVIALTAFLFYVFVHRSINVKLRVSIISIVLITIALVQNISRKMVSPIKKITEATKKVAAGDFTVELETKRDDEIRGINA